MRSRYRVGDSHRAHFITSTIVEWLPVFTTSACCDILVQTMIYSQTHKQLVVAPEHWRYSSAHEWLPGAKPVLRCDLWR